MTRLRGEIVESGAEGDDSGGRDKDMAETAGPPLTADAETLRYLDGLVRETYQLWDQEWVGFTWRNYTYDHVQRVRALALSLAAEEGAGVDASPAAEAGKGVDTRVLDMATLLHDLTKPYDGEVLMRDGQRVVDEQGYWRNAVLPPARENGVTRLYDALGLAGSVHHISGARIADALLAEQGYPTDFRAHVGEIIVSHLKVTAETSLEGRCLYDADTIDANIGLPALYRNIQISMHRLEGQLRERDDTVDAYLAAHLREHLHEYITERWPAWVAGKGRDFVGRLTTEAGHRRALARLERLEGVLAVLRVEVENCGPDLDTEAGMGYLAPITHFMTHRRNPSLAEELALLETRWPASSAYPAAHLLALLRQECAGIL